MSYTNYDIVTQAMKNREASTSTGNMSTVPAKSYYYTGHLSERLRNILNQRAMRGHISQVIYSYGTPIAWLDNGKWIVPDVAYSITTSSKHQSQLYRLPNISYIPWDESLIKYEEKILTGELIYVRGYGKLGSYAKAA